MAKSFNHFYGTSSDSGEYYIFDLKYDYEDDSYDSSYDEFDSILISYYKNYIEHNGTYNKKTKNYKENHFNNIVYYKNIQKNYTRSSSPYSYNFSELMTPALFSQDSQCWGLQLIQFLQEHLGINFTFASYNTPESKDFLMMMQRFHLYGKEYAFKFQTLFSKNQLVLNLFEKEADLFIIWNAKDLSVVNSVLYQRGGKPILLMGESFECFMTTAKFQHPHLKKVRGKNKTKTHVVGELIT